MYEHNQYHKYELSFFSEIRRVAFNPSQWYWIGISDRYSEGRWVFTNGQPYHGLIYNWASGEPNNMDDQDCAVAGTKNLLDDLSCYDSLVYRVLCQIPNGVCLYNS